MIFIKYADINGMLNRVIEICQENRYLSLKRGFLVIHEGESEIGTVPLDDIAVLVLSAQQITMTKNVLNALSENGCITILCGKNYSPQSMIIPTYSHYLFTKILKNQIEASIPFKKRMWQQVVVQKITNQALALKYCGKEDESVLIKKIASLVDSGDTKNREAYAARMYWKFLFGDDFIRDKDGDGINALLNYGYAIVRSAMARAVCAGGLLPSLGIHHDNKTNQFCLVDDIFEVYRPLIDCIVYRLVQNNETALTPDVKKVLAQSLQIKVHTREGDSSAIQSMQYLVASYVNALEYKKPVIELPDWGVNGDGITIIE